ncbi:hypothetical protein [Pseudomonas aeruginosa]|uniref:hypothetical protein n=1 Tax=Pseudomonas aeruginosa TaxID=287 RepID=UPI000F5205A1|nr:hypothetical protein [Pseudomonas aeruginosa]
MKHPFSVLFLSLSLLLPVLHGAGMDCRRAASIPEKAICADDSPRGLDARLGEVYAQALRSDPATAKAQRAASGSGCSDATTAATSANAWSTPNGNASTLCSLSRRRPRKKRSPAWAMGELQRALEVAARENPEFPLERALAVFPQPSATTDFANRDEDGGGVRFPSP